MLRRKASSQRRKKKKKKARAIKFLVGRAHLFFRSAGAARISTKSPGNQPTFPLAWPRPQPFAFTCTGGGGGGGGRIEVLIRARRRDEQC